MRSIAQLLSLGVVSLALPVLASAQTADFVYRIDGPASVASMRITGAAAQWSQTLDDGEAIEAMPEKLPAIRNGAVHLVLKPGLPSSSVEIDAASGLASDWSGRGKLVFLMENASEFMIPITLTIRDADGAVFTADRLWMVRARNRFEIPLADIRTANGTPLNLKKVRSLRLTIRSDENFERDLWLYNLYIAGDGSEAAQRGQMLLDFGPQGTPLLDGSTPIDERTAYAKWRGYGWTSAMADLTSAQFNQPKPDPMLNSMVWANLGAQTATLRVDLPDGDYRARFWGGNYTDKAIAARDFALAVNGKTVASRNVDPATFYTADEYFRGIDDWYQPGEDTWAKFGRDLYQHYDFTFTVRGGKAQFTWSKTLAAFGLLIAPAEQFDAALKRVEADERQAFDANIDPPRPPTASPAADSADQQRGFLLWSRDWQKTVLPYDVPDASELNPRVLQAVAAQGQRVHSTITITPLRSLGWVTASVSQLRDAAGDVLPASAVEVRALKYLWDGWPASLDRYELFPASRAPAYERLNQTWWFTITPPAGAKPGVYTGDVRLLVQGGNTASVPIKIEVLPFQLDSAGESGAAYSLWRNSDYNMGYALRYFMPAKLDYFRRLLRAEAADMKAHGMTAFNMTPPFITGVDGDHVKLDFSLAKEECKVVKEYGLYGPGRPALVFLTIEISRKLMKETRYGDFQEPEELSPMLPDSQRDQEFSPRFNRRFIDAVRQIQAFYDAQGIPIMMQTADEPRERNINQWNRNLAQTIRYDKMIKAALPRVKLYVDPEGDEDSGVSYLPILDQLDYFSPHPWEQAAKMVARAQSGKPVLRYYNGIMNDRYDWGFEVSAAHAHGFSQWHFGWQLQPFQPFEATWHNGYTLAGPDGPIDTTAYEVSAAGIDDYRYIATLRARIADAKKAGITGPAVTDAEAALSELQAGSEPYAMHDEYADARHQHERNTIAGKTLDEWRARMAGCIEAIDKARAGSEK